MMAGALRVLVGAILTVLPLSAHAQEALYGKQAPRGSAFIRFANATAQAVTVSTEFTAETHLGTEPGDRVAPYTAVERASERSLTILAKVGAQEARLTYKLTPDSYATIVLEPGADGAVTIVPIVDQADFNQTRARLAFYNAAPACPAAALVLQPSGPAVFQDVPTGATRSRAINPVQASVRVDCGATPGPSTALAGLEVGNSYSLWFIQPGDMAALFATPDVSARYNPSN